MVVDYCKIFSDHVDHLYTLSLLLTADHGRAEQCLVAGLEDCVQANPVFREWAHAWATRTIIKNAIQMISPGKSETTASLESAAQLASEAGTLALAIMALPPLERFAYVMSVLEKYSDRECAKLLDCTVQEVVSARTYALERLAKRVHAATQQAQDLSVPVLS